jgi:hypothetical protein
MAISDLQWGVIERRLLAGFSLQAFSLSGRTLYPGWVKTNKSGQKMKLCVFIDGRADQHIGCTWMTCYDEYTALVWRKKVQTLSSVLMIKRIRYTPIFSSTESFLKQYKKLEGLEVIER